MSQIDYLAIGHFSRDITSFGEMTGGTVAYSGATAAVLGCRTAILSSYAPDFQPGMGDLDIAVEIVPAPETTTFKNIYQNGSRQQVLYGRASQLTVEDVPPAWTRASIVHLAPVAGEVDLAMAAQFTNSLLGLTPQGWLRAWAEDGRVFPSHWQAARRVLPLAAAVVLSSEDLADEDWAVEFRKWARLLVLTHGAAGCTVYMGEEARRFPAPRVAEVDPTGAGDVFAAAFFVRLFQTRGNPWEAATFANKMAAATVAERDLPAKIRRLQQEK